MHRPNASVRRTPLRVALGEFAERYNRGRPTDPSSNGHPPTTRHDPVASPYRPDPAAEGPRRPYQRVRTSLINPQVTNSAGFLNPTRVWLFGSTAFDGASASPWWADHAQSGSLGPNRPNRRAD